MAEAPLTHGAAFSSGESHAGKRNRQTQSPLQCASRGHAPHAAALDGRAQCFLVHRVHLLVQLRMHAAVC